MSQDLTLLQTELGLPLPEGARVLFVEREKGMDDRVRAKLELSRSDFDRFADKLPVKLEQFARGAGRLGADDGAWNPQTTPGIRSAQTRLEGARYLGIGVAESQGGQVVVFVVNHGT